MKIQLNDLAAIQSAAERSTKQVSNGAVSTQSAAEDRTTFNSDSASVQALVGQALKSPEIRQDKVDAIRQALNAGQYKVDTQKVAAAIIASNEK